MNKFDASGEAEVHLNHLQLLPSANFLVKATSPEKRAFHILNLIAIVTHQCLVPAKKDDV
jgi:hypothetical protein